MTFKKAEMAKSLKNGLIMIETNPLNHNWSHFVILSGLTLHQFQKKLLLSENSNYWRESLLEGVYIPNGKSQLQGFEKIYVGSLFSGYLKGGVLGAWMTFKKAEMAKTLRNGLSMIETIPFNHNWLDFVI